MTQNTPAANLPPKSKYFYGYTIVITSFIVLTIMFGGYLSYGVFLNPVISQFGWSHAVMSGAFSVSMALHGILGIFMGGLTDKLGPKIVILLCGVFLGLGYILMSTTNNVWQLYVYFGILIGIGISGSWVAILSTVSRWFVTRRSIMMGIVLSGAGIGTLIISPTANWLITTYSWRTSYIVLGAVTLVITVIGALFLQKDPAKMGLVPYGVKPESENKHKSSQDGLTLKQASGTRQFWLACLLLLCFGFIMLSINIHIVAHATDKGFSPATSSLILALIGGASIGGRILMGHLADKKGPKLNFIISFSLAAVSLLGFMFADDLWMFILFAIFFGFLIGGMAVAEAPLIASLFGLRSHGLILGVADFGFTVGAAIGPLMAGLIFDSSKSYRWAFLIIAIVAIIGLLLTTQVKPLARTLTTKD